MSHSVFENEGNGERNRTLTHNGYPCGVKHTMDLLANLFHSDPDKFFKTDLQNFPTFWDWLIEIRQPFDVETGHAYWEPAVRAACIGDDYSN